VPVAFSPPFSLEVAVDTTICTLKDLLHQHHPMQPLADDQRLIYQGRQRQDNEALSDIIKDDWDAEHVFHLVLRSGKYDVATACSAAASHELPLETGAKGSIVSDAELPASEPLLVYVPHTGQTLMVDPSQCFFVNGLPYVNLNAIEHPPSGTPQIAAVHPEPPASLPQQQMRSVNWIWLVTKMAFFSVLFSQNASTARVVLINLIVVVIFLFQAKLIRFRVPVAASSTSASAAATQLPVESIPLRIFRELKNVFVPLFSSLIPSV
jgi:hypothetical protein